MSPTLFSVHFEPLYLGLALVLLWLPRQWLRLGSIFSGSSRGRKPRPWAPNRDREPGDVTVRFGEEFAKARNWVDLLRAFAGGAAIGGLFAGVAAFSTTDPKPTKEALQFIFTLKILVLFAGLLVQMLRYEGRITLFAPLFYVQGLAFGLLGWKCSLLAIVAIWAVNPVLPSAAVFLFVFGALELCVGFIFEKEHRKETLLAAGLSILPVLVSVLGKRRLAQFTKKTKIVSTSSSSGAD